MVSEFEVIEKRKGSRSERKAKTRAALIRSAFSLFAERGALATTTDEVARAAGMSHGTVFVHFPTQADLVEAVVGEFGTRLNARLHELAEGAGDLDVVLATHLAVLRENEGFYTRLVIESRLLPECARTALLGLQSTASYHIGLAAERAMEAGTIRPMPVALLFNTWIALVHYYLMNGDLFAPGGSVLQARGDELLSHFKNLIGLSP